MYTEYCVRNMFVYGILVTPYYEADLLLASAS